jgi:AbrB family looped-hinge helix DNA binding protein
MAYGKLYAMKLRMDKAGRIVVPKPLRKRLGLQSEAELEVVEQADGILLRPERPQPSMVRVRGLWVHQGVPEPGTDWDRVLDDVREERIRDIIHPR